MTRVSIKHIAGKLGVSNATVSLVLNGKEKEGRVGKETADKIRQVASEMNYEPNNLARGFRIGKSHTIGLIVADISNPFFANLAFYIQEQAEKFGYSVIITNTNESDLKMEKMVQVLKNRQVDGFLIVPTEYGEPYVADLVNRNLPVVLIDRYFPALNVSSVIVDNYNASVKAVENLVNRGCKNIGLVIYKNSLQHILERKRGYMDALKEHGYYNPALIKEVNYSLMQDDIVIAIEGLLAKENKLDGIFFATNTLFTSGIKQLKLMQADIPNHIKLVTFDKSEAFEWMNISIPYILQPIPDMGKMAVELLVEQIGNNAPMVKCIELQTSLKEAP
ncbi:MAG: LacI family transcriptional regulator [Tannerella sp.]|nr:LacI family transcriptional regulator [Tannerella sp.]